MIDSHPAEIKIVLHAVPDLAAAKRLYTAVLGVPPQVDSSRYVGFEVGDQHVGLLPGGAPQDTRSPVAYWHVPDLEARLSELVAAGATVTEEARDVDRGRVVAAVADLNGNVVGLVQGR